VIFNFILRARGKFFAKLVWAGRDPWEAGGVG